MRLVRLGPPFYDLHSTCIKQVFTLFLIVFLNTKASTQELIYENFGVDEGLPSSEVYDVYQDIEGYIWFATDKGLSRYNGYEFQNFNTSDGLPGNVVLRFYPQSNGQIWCYSYHSKSLFCFNEVFNGFKQYQYNDVLKKELRKNSVVKSVYLDKHNNLHIGGLYINGEIIIQNNGEVKTRYDIEDFYSDTISLKSIVINNISDSITTESYFTTLDTAQVGNFLFHCKYSSNRIFMKWLVENEIAVFMTSSQVELLLRNQEIITIKTKYSPAGIKIIDNNHFFIGYEFGGCNILDKNGTVIREFLPNESVSNFLIDHEGGYWFTTLNSGVHYAKNPSVSIFNSKSIKPLHVNSMVKTKEDELLVGYKNGTITMVLDNIENIENGKPKISSHAFVEYDPISAKTYIYNNSTLKERHKNNTLYYEYFVKLSEPNGNSLFATSGSNFYEIRRNDTSKIFDFSYRVHDVCTWNKDTLIATPIGIFKYQNDTHIPLSTRSDLYQYRSDDIDVNYNNNILYIATQGAGLVINDGNRTFNISEQDGLNSNIVNEVHIENDSSIWVCTNRGVNRIIWSENGMKISSMSKKDGLLSNEVEDIEIINDTVWVGTKEGLCNFPKSQLKPKTIDLSILKLKEVFVNDASQSNLTKANLSYSENSIDFVLEGISYAYKGDIYYEYRLGENNNWHKTNNRTIQFSSLSPGNYEFEARMCIENKTCSDTTIKYIFTIHAPFWKRWWFILFCLLIASLLVYTFFKIRVLTYNKDVIRELIRLVIKKLKKEEMYFTFRENGDHVRIKTEEILYIKSAGNYIDLYTNNNTHTIRLNIGKFLDNVPDQLEYVRLHRSYIVRIDKIKAKSKSEVQLINGIKIPVSQNHHKRLKEVVF